jgi:hypothetical protein
MFVPASAVAIVVRVLTFQQGQIFAPASSQTQFIEFSTVQQFSRDRYSFAPASSQTQSIEFSTCPAIQPGQIFAPASSQTQFIEFLTCPAILQ